MFRKIKVGTAQVMMLGLIVGCQTMDKDGKEQSSTDLASPATPAVIQPAEQLPSSETVAAIYADMDEAVAAYTEAQAMIESGSLSAGQTVAADAINALDLAVNRCQVEPECDTGKAVRRYQAILEQQAFVFTEPAAAMRDADAGDTDSLGNGSAPSLPVASNNSLQGQDLRDHIPMNRQVQESLYDWLTWNRPLLMRTAQHYRELRGLMAPEFINAGMPEALLFGIMAVESGGRVHSYSRAGAVGPLQFMRATARRYGLREQDGFDQRLDAKLAAKATVAYLADRLNELGGSLDKSLAAYNAGENRLKRLDRKMKGKSLWTPEYFYSLPRDTRHYVPNVMAAALLFLDAEKYNLDLDLNGTAPDSSNLANITLENEMALGELALCAGGQQRRDGWFRDLRNLNPQVSPDERIGKDSVVVVPKEFVSIFERECAGSELLSLAAELHEAAYDDESEMRPYVIQRGDSLGRIAGRHRCMSMQEIAAMNNIKPPRYPLRAGKTIQVPNC